MNKLHFKEAYEFFNKPFQTLKHFYKVLRALKKALMVVMLSGHMYQILNKKVKLGFLKSGAV